MSEAARGKRMRLVLIEWQDSCGCSPDWKPLEGYEAKPLLCRSVGWLLHDGDACKVIVPHVSDSQEQGCGDMTIPTTAILKISDLAASAAV